MLYEPYKFPVDNIDGLRTKFYVTAGKKDGTTLGTKATAEGSSNTSSGNCSHAEGNSSVASGNYSHAEGYSTASGIACHSEGYNTTASNTAAHSEGQGSTASGLYSHAEGYNTVAHYNYSHAEGHSTKTGNNVQHVQGKWNVGKGTTAFEIGNGTANNARSNAFEVDWDGDVTASGNITDGSGNVLSNKLDTSKLVLIRQKINASGWSPNPINGYYATSLYTTDSFRTSPTPSIKATGASDSTLITDAQAEAYKQILFPNGYVEQNGNTRFDLHAKTKPTSDFYILIEGILV